MLKILNINKPYCIKWLTPIEQPPHYSQLLLWFTSKFEAFSYQFSFVILFIIAEKVFHLRELKRHCTKWSWLQSTRVATLDLDWLRYFLFQTPAFVYFIMSRWVTVHQFDVLFSTLLHIFILGCYCSRCTSSRNEHCPDKSCCNISKLHCSHRLWLLQCCKMYPSLAKYPIICNTRCSVVANSAMLRRNVPTVNFLFAQFFSSGNEIWSQHYTFPDKRRSGLTAC